MKHTLSTLGAAAALGLACLLGASPAWSKTPSAKALCKRQAAAQHLAGGARRKFLKTCEAQAKAQAKANAKAGARPAHHLFGHPAAAATPQGAQPAQPAKAAPRRTGKPASSGGNPSVRVWVNTPTRTYHCPGDRYYGKTHSGQYLTQAAAQAAGDRAARGKLCN